MVKSAVFEAEKPLEMGLDLWKFWNNCLISHLEYPLQHLTAKRTTFVCLSLHGNIWDTYTRPQIQILEDYVDFVSLDCVYTRTVQYWSRSLSVLRVVFINVTLTHLWHFTMHFYECTSITGASMYTYANSCYQVIQHTCSVDISTPVHMQIMTTLRIPLWFCFTICYSDQPQNRQFWPVSG